MGVLIVSIADDLHALSVQAAIRKRGVPCDILETDHLTSSECISFSINSQLLVEGTIVTAEGLLLSVSNLDLIWWRRPKAIQCVGKGLTQEQIGLINNDCTGALFGIFENAFKGKWISSPRATEHASNKLNQLAVAAACGLRIPETLVTQSPKEVRAFHDKHQGKVIVKPVVGTPGPLLFTQFVTSRHLEAEESIRACPAIYQQFIEGTRHIRLNCFGSRSYASRIESAELDWRPNLNVPVNRWEVPTWLHQKIRTILDTLNLEMGIIDLKEAEDGGIVWLEVNPQGQFLFLEGLTKMPLTEIFAEYLCEEVAGLSKRSHTVSEATAPSYLQPSVALNRNKDLADPSLLTVSSLSSASTPQLTN